jgi:acetylornithine deacetylase/succinyl-diaminopimelate desuccinylase-like protein
MIPNAHLLRQPRYAPVLNVWSHPMSLSPILPKVCKRLLSSASMGLVLPLLFNAPASADISALRSAVDAHLASEGPQMLGEFRELLSLPNVSTVREDMYDNARWISDYISDRGFSPSIVEAGGAPYIIAERKTPGATRTVLIYAHYDGQPVEPTNWATPPFTPTLKAGSKTLDWSQLGTGSIDPDWRVYARSAGDDKGPVIALMHAIDAMDAAGMAASVNVKLILDGEEEFGSPTVAQILAENGDKLDADLMLFCDGPMHQSGRRQLVFGVRGDMGVHLTVYGASRPLHSGHYGNWAPHPTDALLRLLATLKDMDGNILVPGYLDEVVPISEAEQVAIAAMPSVDAQLRDELALGRVEGGGKRLETLIMQPAINIVGFQAGGVGAQARNIILPTATASLDLRLVPGQSIAAVRAALEAHFEAQGFFVTDEEPSEELRRSHPGVIKIDWDGGYPAYRSDLNGAEAQRLSSILSAYEGSEPLMTPTMGGSLPIHLFDQALDMPIVLLPIANHDNNQHGRDENMRLGNLFSAVGVYAAVLYEFGRDQGQSD